MVQINSEQDPREAGGPQPQPPAKDSLPVSPETEFQLRLAEIQNLIDTSQHQQALAELDQALEDWPAPEQQVELLLQRGLAQRMIAPERRYSAAVASFITATEQAKKLANFDALIQALVGRADLLRTSGRDKIYFQSIGGDKRKALKRAQEFLNKAGTYLEKLDGPTIGQHKLLNELALLEKEFVLLTADDAEKLKRLETAEGHEQVAVKLAGQGLEESTDDGQQKAWRDRLARSLTTLGVTLSRLGKLRDAYDAQKAAFDLYDQIGDRRGAGNAAVSLAHLLSGEHDFIREPEPEQRLLPDSDQANAWWQTAFDASTRVEGTQVVVTYPDIYDSIKKALLPGFRDDASIWLDPE